MMQEISFSGTLRLKALKPTSFNASPPVSIQAQQFQFKPNSFNSSPTVSTHAHQFQFKLRHPSVSI